MKFKTLNVGCRVLISCYIPPEECNSALYQGLYRLGRNAILHFTIKVYIDQVGMQFCTIPRFIQIRQERNSALYQGLYRLGRNAILHYTKVYIDQVGTQFCTLPRFIYRLGRNAILHSFNITYISFLVPFFPCFLVSLFTQPLASLSPCFNFPLFPCLLVYLFPCPPVPLFYLSPCFICPLFPCPLFPCPMYPCFIAPLSPCPLISGFLTPCPPVPLSFCPLFLVPCFFVYMKTFYPELSNSIQHFQTILQSGQNFYPK